MTGREIVLAHGANLRCTILNAHSNFGSATGLRVLKRFAYETGLAATDLHSREEAAAILYAAADAIAGGIPITDPEPDASVIDLTGPESEEKLSEEPPVALTSSRAPEKVWSWSCWLHGAILGGLFALMAGHQ